MPYVFGFATFMIFCGIALPKATGELKPTLSGIPIRLLINCGLEFALTSYIFFWTVLAGSSFAYVWANVSVVPRPLILTQADHMARCRELLTSTGLVSMPPTRFSPIKDLVSVHRAEVEEQLCLGTGKFDKRLVLWVCESLALKRSNWAGRRGT